MKYHTYTRSNVSVYAIPDGKRVLGVTYAEQGWDHDIPFFYIGESEPVWHVTSMNGQPQNAEEIKTMLQRVHGMFGFPCWYSIDELLVIWPPALNDGDVLILDLVNAG